MGYYEDQLAQYQNRIKDMVDPGQIPGQRKQITDRLASVQSGFSRDVADIVGGQMEGAGRDVASGYSRDFGRKNEELAGKFELNRKRTLFNQYYNYALENYLEQGRKLRDSEAAARQWAADKVAMSTSAEAAEKSRTDRRAKQDVANQYQGMANNLSLDQGNPYEQALMRSMFGLATTAATYKILTHKDKPKIKPESTPSSGPVAGEGIDWDYIDNQYPYSRSGSGGMAGTGR